MLMPLFIASGHFLNVLVVSNSQDKQTSTCRKLEHFQGFQGTITSPSRPDTLAEPYSRISEN